MRKIVILLAVLCCAACTNWEKTTYQSLVSAKATIDCASAEYNHNDGQITQYCAGVVTPSAVYLPQTATVHDILSKSDASYHTAANAMLAYEASKAAKGSTDQATLQANVNTAVAALVSEVATITSIVKGGK